MAGASSYELESCCGVLLLRGAVGSLHAAVTSANMTTTDADNLGERSADTRFIGTLGAYMWDSFECQWFADSELLVAVSEFREEPARDIRGRRIPVGAHAISLLDALDLGGLCTTRSRLSWF
jgi:hypothetical protein